MKGLLVAVSAFVADVAFVEVALVLVVEVVARKYFSNCRNAYKKKKTLLSSYIYRFDSFDSEHPL